MKQFLRCTEIIDWMHPEIMAKASVLAHPFDPQSTAQACFEFVRDEIRHSSDHQMNPVTCRASDVLSHGTGYCFAKSHLLAALLRANGIPAGFCYQRLSLAGDGPPFCLHGFNAVRLPGTGWYRVDARGNKAGVDARWTPPDEQLAFEPQPPDEYEFEDILPDPMDCVVDVLVTCATWQEVLARLPDASPADFDRLGLTIRTGATATSRVIE